MSSIESLKEQARRHEQKEDWQKALDLYLRAIERLAEEEQPDIGLYNRVGDLFTRTGEYEKAVDHFQSAIDLYLEAELPNNAIAVCKKIIRHLPDRYDVYLRMGQIRAGQGFLVDARQNFLTYAERATAAGEIDDALKSLIEFAELAPDDTEVRMAVATQLEQHERTDEAVEQLAAGYRVLLGKGEAESAEVFAEKIKELDPSADLEALAAAPEGGELAFEATGLGGGDDMSAFDALDETGFDDILSGQGAAAASQPDSEGWPSLEEAGADEDEEGDGFGDMVFSASYKGETEPSEGEGEGGEEEEESYGFSLDAGDGEQESGDEEDVASPLPGLDEDEAGAEATALEELPLMSFDDDEEDEKAAPLPLLGEEAEDDGPVEAEPIETFFDEIEAGEEEAEPLPLMSFDEPASDAPEASGAVAEAMEEAAWDQGDEAAPSEAAPTAAEAPPDEAAAAPGSETAPAADDPRGAWESLMERCRTDGAGSEQAQEAVELAFKLQDNEALIDSYMLLAQALEAEEAHVRARAVYQQVLNLDGGNAPAQQALERLSAAGEVAGPAKEVAAADDYVDLGSLIFDDEEEKTTRFVVAYEEPSGDEAADFRKMLDQFKAKVSENVDVSDVQAHHDLGTAYKEMGLLDEAVEEFQKALRASSEHLPTYELLGQTFMEKGEFAAAVRVMERALKVPHEIEDELIALYYYLGRAHEEMEKTDAALEYYDQVFSLDINFADVTDRLRRLR